MQGKTITRKTAAKTGDLQGSERHQPGGLAHRFTPPPAHAGVKLHPPQNPTLPLQSPSARRGTPRQRPASVPPPQNRSLSAAQAPRTGCRAACDGDDELVPVRDGDGVARCSLKESCGPQESCCRGGTKAETVRCLLEELRALSAGQGSVAETLLRRLEQTVGGPDSQGAALSENPQVCRCVKNQHEEEEEPQEEELLLCSEVMVPCDPEPRLQKELAAAQSSLQELQDDLTELRKALQDTRSQLRHAEAEKGLLKTEWEAARNRLQESEREKSQLALVAQQRLKEIENLRRLIPRRSSAEHLDMQSSLSLTKQRFSQQHPAVVSTERIKEYLISLNQVEPTEPVPLSAERDESSPHSIRHEQRGEPTNKSSSEDALPCGQQLLNATSLCDVESVWSNWSMKSESTFNTRDEAAFRDGLAALDASIASLQRTIQLDLQK